MGYVESNLAKGEQVTYRAKLHWFIYVGPAVLCLLLLIFLPGWSRVLSVLPLLVPWLTQVTSEFAVTNQRVIVKVGWISRKTIELKLNKIESVAVDQGVIGRIFNFGTITVVGTGGSRDPSKHIADPLAFRQAVNRATEAFQPNQATA